MSKPVDSQGIDRGPALLTVAQRQASLEILRTEPFSEAALELGANVAVFADRAIRVVLSVASPSEIPQCMKGCAACCYLHTTASAPEVLLIADEIRSNEDLFDRDAIRRKLSDHILLTDGMTAEERNRTRLACPFLDDNACSIYAVRPLVCRGWNSLDLNLCYDDLNNPGAGIVANLNMKQYLSATQIGQGMAEALDQMGYDGRPLDMVRGVAIALLLEDSALSWFSGDDPFRLAVNQSVFPS